MLFRATPDCIRLHLSFSRTDSMSLCSGDMSGLIKKGLGNDPLFDRILVTSEILISFKRIGLGRLF